MNTYYTIRIKKCMNWYKNHTMYEFVIYNLYNNFCMNSYKKKNVWIGTKTTPCTNSQYTICITIFVWIRTKISEKKICIRVGISTRDQNGLQSSQRYTTCHPTTSIIGHVIYIPYNKNTIRKSGLYGFRVTYVTRLEMGLPSEKVDYTVWPVLHIVNPFCNLGASLQLAEHAPRMVEAFH